jgi:hypothetical protein
MKININPVIEDNEIAETKSYKMYSHILEALDKSDYLTLDTTSIQKEYPNVSFPESTDLNVIFKNKNKELLNSINQENEAFGAFVLIDEQGLLTGNKGHLDSFNVVIFIDDKEMEKLIEHEAFLDIESGIPYEYSIDFHLVKFCNTLTHEIEHVIEFIENAGGLTPFQVKEMNSSGKFDYNLFSCMSGYGMDKYGSTYETIEQKLSKNDITANEAKEGIIKIIEERVETSSKAKLEALSLDLFSIYKAEPNVQKKKKRVSSPSLSM